MNILTFCSLNLIHVYFKGSTSRSRTNGDRGLTDRGVLENNLYKVKMLNIGTRINTLRYEFKAPRSDYSAAVQWHLKLRRRGPAAPYGPGESTVIIAFVYISYWLFVSITSVLYKKQLKFAELIPQSSYNAIYNVTYLYLGGLGDDFGRFR